MSQAMLDSTGADIGSLGVGLRGMSERIQQLNGTLDIHSSSNGTTVTATIPVNEPAIKEHKNE
jgi:signal transduction histidine kinase